ncbi:SRPBCC domain-containing protein [Microbacterium sp. NEAU-LLC]|uniref:SRPBCC domain-containing protein n=1 Tax=Microbacterium helvum TaxID=2773713 RepID=A0ABR8NTY8_9MICO|nr:SRPBCC domain-containing protein [Microbacterium helvum]MBD3943071.1 SRPBCC domain-containing protein [Microbacterium helvum]
MSNPNEYGSIEQSIFIAASPEVVYDVVSRPEHLNRWWTDEAVYQPVPGGSGYLAWGDRATTRPTEVTLTVVEAVPGERFSFRWIYPRGETPTPENSMLVTFSLVPDSGGTRLTVTEEGMREQGWEAAKLEAYYLEHVDGWMRHLADLARYAPAVVERVDG